MMRLSVGVLTAPVRGPGLGSRNVHINAKTCHTHPVRSPYVLRLAWGTFWPHTAPDGQEYTMVI